MTDSMAGRTALVAGATGLVGSEVVAQLLQDPRVARVIAVGRRPMGIQHERLLQLTASFDDAEALKRLFLSVPGEIDDAYCCLGTTRKKAGSAEAFIAVDYTAVVHFADAARSRGAQRLLLVSSLGADPRSGMLYARTKGEAEAAVQQLGFSAVAIARPSILDGERAEDRPGERLGLTVGRALAALVGRERRFAPIPAASVARALIRLAFDIDNGVKVALSDELHRLARAG